MSDKRFITVVIATLTLLVLGLAAVVALTLANKPVSTVIYLIGGFTATTLPGLASLAIAKDTNYTIKNGLGQKIAEATAHRVTQQAAQVAADLAAGRTPETVVSSGDTPQQEGAA